MCHSITMRQWIHNTWKTPNCYLRTVQARNVFKKKNNIKKERKVYPLDGISISFRGIWRKGKKENSRSLRMSANTKHSSGTTEKLKCVERLPKCYCHRIVCLFIWPLFMKNWAEVHNSSKEPNIRIFEYKRYSLYAKNGRNGRRRAF